MDEIINGPVFARRFVLDHKCQENAGHKHNYDHSTLVMRGRILVVAHDDAGQELWRQEFGWGERCFIAAYLHHTIKALEENTVYDCVFSHRDFEGQVSQRYIGNQTAYT